MSACEWVSVPPSTTVVVAVDRPTVAAPSIGGRRDECDASAGVPGRHRPLPAFVDQRPDRASRPSRRPRRRRSRRRPKPTNPASSPRSATGSASAPHRGGSAVQCRAQPPERDRRRPGPTGRPPRNRSAGPRARARSAPDSPTPTQPSSPSTGRTSGDCRTPPRTGTALRARQTAARPLIPQRLLRKPLQHPVSAER